MKKILLLISILFAGMTLAGCDQITKITESTGLTSVKMDTEKANKRVVANINKYVDQDSYKLIAVYWQEMEALSNKVGILLLTMVGEDGKVYNQSFKIGGDYQGPNDIEESSFYSKTTYDFTSVKYLTIKDINSDLILRQYEAAASEVPDEYNYKGINKYNLTIDPETGEKSYLFSINVTEKGNATSAKGGRIVTTYYEVEFHGFEDGTVEMKEE